MKKQIQLMIFLGTINLPSFPTSMLNLKKLYQEAMI